MAFKFETFRHADVNIGHLRREDRELLRRLGPSDTTDPADRLQAVNLVRIGAAYGSEGSPRCYFVGIGTEFKEDDKAVLVEVGFSAEFVEIIWHLVKQEIFYVRFDVDGYEVEGAPRFE